MGRDMGFEESYLLQLIHEKRFLVITGLVALVSYLNPKYRKFHDPVASYFDHLLKQQNDGMEPLELLQALVMNCSYKFTIGEPKQSLLSINEIVILIQQHNFHLLDLIPPTPDAMDDEQYQITQRMKRCVYWYTYQVDKYTTYGTGMGSRLPTIDHHVCLPGSGTSFGALKEFIFDEVSIPLEDLRFKCRPLHIRDYHLISLYIFEIISIWYKKVDFVNNATTSNPRVHARFMKDLILKEFREFDLKLEKFQNLYEYTLGELDDSTAEGKSYFSKLFLPTNCQRSLLRQVTMEYLSNFKDEETLKVSESLRKEMLEILVEAHYR
ncbi:unnamed protein product [Ambrosiozyma monospora]|uniref:Unnamed protein product n=1 Tax=Ambrosiozyma monospora TaxID=43982 RepID=A0ACB5TVS6_AMBMO|nr:unnamed protein product [Ambrosiozyma monospora]